MEISQVAYERVSAETHHSEEGEDTSFSYQRESLTITGFSQESSRVDLSQPTPDEVAEEPQPLPEVPAYRLSEEDAQRLRDTLQNELLSYKEQIIKHFIEQNGGTVQDSEPVENDPEVAALEARMPDYWSAENTAQRIVDFATSFLSAFEGENSEFFSIIRGAIEDGIGEAKALLGNLPGPVGKLIDKTHRLVFEKLDAVEAQLKADSKPQPDQPAAEESISLVA